MTTSFAQIARTMDPMDPVRSLRELANRHRWPNGLPPVVSLRVLGLRHDHPDTTVHRVLCFNTWLMHALQISLCNLIHVGRVLPILKSRLQEWWISQLPASELIEPFNITTDMLAQAFALELPKQLLVDTFPSIASSFFKTILEEVKEWGPLGWIVKWVEKTVAKPVEEVTKEEILGKLSPYDLVDNFKFMTTDEIITRIGLDAGKIAVAFCREFAGWLSEQTDWQIDATLITVGEAGTNRPARATAIGQMLAKDYDVAGLCEVWEPQRQADVLKAAAATGRSASGHLGPLANGEVAGSGLLTVTFDGRSKDGSGGTPGDPFDIPGIPVFEGDPKNTHVFSNQGDYIKDADAWSRKGVLLTVLNLGVGRVDLYTTHLYQGGEALIDPTDEDILSVKLSQIKEIVEFIGDTHDPDHVAVLMGDFNIASHDAEYVTMMQQLGAADLVDLWPFWSSSPIRRRVLHRGGTNNPDLCEPKDPNQPFCSEPGTKESTPPLIGRRIDYIFVEKPRADHPFTVDFTRVRRRGDQFSGSDLSDHLGLDVTLIVSPVTHIPA